MKKKIDIEKLVQWAMREELPKGSPVAASSWELISRFGTLGTRVDESHGSPDGLGFVPGAPHADALIVADAIKGLGRARFGERVEVLMLFGDLAAIAGDAVEAIMAASFDQQSLVLSKAVQSTRPPWDFPHPTPRQIWTPYRDKCGSLRERQLVHGIDADGVPIAILPKRTARERGVYDLNVSPQSPINWCDPSLISIGHARAEYVAWFRALTSLALDLADRLGEYAPTLPAIKPAPWITGQTPASRVLSDGLPPGLLTVKLALQPKRRAPTRPPGRPRDPGRMLDSSEIGR